jgi:uncharacterized protein
MHLLIATFIAFCVVMAGMAIGVIVSNRRITGSCGGLANMKAEDGEPMCECGARPGESCGADPDRRFDLDRVAIDEELPATEHETVAV